MLSQLGQVLVGVADSVMVGRVGTEPLAAATLANSIFFVVLVFGIGVSYAITPLVAAADGEGNQERCTSVFRNALLLNTTLGIVLFVTVALASFILPYLDQPAEVVSLAIPYLNIITLSIIPFMLFQTFRQFAEGLSQTRQAMFITIGANAINIGLNYLLIFGKWGFEPLGLNGAGYATLVSRILMALAMGLLIYHSPTFRAYRLGFQLRNFSNKILKRL
ncbi:MAG: MATE family efflux transporter, partial [Cyclobacteriaceae bacterium]